MNNQEIDQLVGTSVKKFNALIADKPNLDDAAVLMNTNLMTLWVMLAEIAKRMPEPVQLRYEDPT